VKRWLQEQLAPLRVSAGVAVVIDPDRLLQAPDFGLETDVYEAEDWFSLRSIFEHRVRDGSAKPITIHVASDEFSDSRDLPYDIDKAATVVRIRIPVPAAFRRLVIDLPDDLSDRATKILQRASEEPLAALLAELWGVALEAIKGSEDQQFELTVRLRTDPSVPASLWILLRPLLTSRLASALAHEPPDLVIVQEAWEEWVEQGAESDVNEVFEAIGPGITPLFHSGLLRPASATAVSLPSWTRIGIRDLSFGEQTESLLEARPDEWPPASTAGWKRAAEWWGELRGVLAEGAPDTANLAEAAWGLWDELNDAFKPWLMGGFARLLTSTGSWPATVDKLVGFLARRLREGVADRVLLIVIDGMGYGQWATLRRHTDLQVVEAEATFGMIPTLTSISRQAIFAGTLPINFAESLRKTSKEEARWKAAWAGEGVDVTDVSYKKMAGGLGSQIPAFGNEQVVGMVVTAVDEILHGSDLLGDAQVTQAVVAWARHGYLDKVVRHACEQGFEVWLTADHGNLESLPLGRISEGLLVESAGVRVRWYRDASLRESARPEGISWDPPGLPKDKIFPLFAPERGGYFSGELRVTHGGLSLDEVVVPLVQVTI